MKKGVKIAIIVGAVVLLVGGILGFTIIKDLKQENDLAKEVDKISKMVSTKNYNKEEVNKLLERRIAKGDYKTVEDALKTYMSDSLKRIEKLESISKDERLAKVLTAENYKKDGPDFKETKKYISDTKKELETVKNEILNALDKEKVKQYIKDKKVDKYYEEFYEKLAFGDEEILKESDKKKFDTAINAFNELLDIQNDVVTFLSTNKGKWEVKGDKVMFYSQSLLTKYNGYLTKLQILSTKVNNL